MKTPLLYNSLILSDFGIIPNLINNSYIISKKGITKSKSISLLDLPQLVMSLKQLIRILNYLKQYESSTIQIIISNKQHFYLITEYFNKKPLNSSISLIFKTGFSYDQVNIKPGLFFTIILDSSNLFNRTSILKNLILDSKFLVQKVNCSLDKQNSGVYKIFNELSNIKKILYLSVLIEKTLSKNHEV